MSLPPAIPQPAKPKRGLAVTGIVLGSLLTLAPVFGLLGTVFGMIGAFQVLGDKGIADPQALSTQIGTVLQSTATGIFVFPFGVLLLALSIIFYPRRPRYPAPPIA